MGCRRSTCERLPGPPGAVRDDAGAPGAGRCIAASNIDSKPMIYSSTDEGPMTRSTSRHGRTGLALVRIAGHLARSAIVAGRRALILVASLCALVAFLDAIGAGK